MATVRACLCTACDMPLLVPYGSTPGTFTMCTWCGWSLIIGPGPTLHNLSPDEVAEIKSQPEVLERILAERERICTVAFGVNHDR